MIMTAVMLELSRARLAAAHARRLAALAVRDDVLPIERVACGIVAATEARVAEQAVRRCTALATEAEGAPAVVAAGWEQLPRRPRSLPLHARSPPPSVVTWTGP